MKPRILVVPSLTWKAYVDAVNGAGGEATLYEGGEIDTSYDGLLLGGGPDVNPLLYGEEVNGANSIDHERDKNDLALTMAYLKTGKPILCICRGCQFINVYFGGTLIQDLPNAKEHQTDTLEIEISHGATTREGSFARKVFGENPIVNSYHHQAVKDVAPSFDVTMMSSDGTVIEAIEHKALPIWAFQFHPERMCFDFKKEGTTDSTPLFEEFIKRCQK